MPATADAPPIVSLCLAAFAGADRAAANLARTTGLTRHITLSSPDPRGNEVEFAVAHLRERRPALLICNGWSPVYAAILRRLRRLPIAVAVQWHSSPAQTDLAAEWPALHAILAETRIGHLLVASATMFRALAPHLPHARHLPDTLDPAEWESPATRSPARRGAPYVTLFAQPAEAARKNVAGCLLALAALRRPPSVHLNGLSRDPRYAALLRRLPRHRDWGWMTRARYDAVVRGAAAGLQVSLAETYGYVVAEHLARGIPVLGTAAVPVLARLSPALRRHLVVANPDDAGEIAAKLDALLAHPRRATAIGAGARAESARWNRRDIAAATAALRALLAEPKRRAS